MRCCEVRFATANLRHFPDKTDQVVVAGQHERVDENSLLAAPADFFESPADNERVEAKSVPVSVAVFKCQGGRLTVRNHDDLLHVLPLLAQQFLGKNEAVAGVR